MIPTVSIIMPIKNASEWVLETIESIQRQTLENWELIIIDDHSEDDSPEKITQAVSKDKRIHLFKNRGTGIVTALNQAFQRVNGEFITRMDADDVMPGNRLQIMSSCLEKHSEKTIVTGKVRYFPEEIVSEGYRKYENWLNERVDTNDFYKHIYRECIVASPNWMGRTEAFKKYRLLENLNYPEDYDLCFRWMQHGFKIEGLNELTLLWREHPLRTSRNSGHYQQQAFFRLKSDWLMYFYPQASSVGIIGLGIKGKLCAEYFQQANYPFQLYDLNFDNYSSRLYGKRVLSPEKVDDELVLIARYPENLKEIQSFIEQKGYQIGKNAFWV